MQSETSSSRLQLLPMILEAQEAFLRDLEQLLKERPGEWVAYHGSKRVAFAKTDLALFEECRRRTIPKGEFLIRCVEPEVRSVLIGPRSIER